MLGGDGVDPDDGEEVFVLRGILLRGIVPDHVVALLSEGLKVIARSGLALEEVRCTIAEEDATAIPICPLVPCHAVVVGVRHQRGGIDDG